MNDSACDLQNYIIMNKNTNYINNTVLAESAILITNINHLLELILEKIWLKCCSSKSPVQEDECEIAP